MQNLCAVRLNINDEFAIHYYWPIFDGVWAHGDKGYVSLNGYSGDQYILDGVLGDDVASGGQSNFLAKGMISGGYYWFEFRKDLNARAHHSELPLVTSDKYLIEHQKELGIQTLDLRKL